MDQFIGGIRPGEEAQVQQARVVQRVQTSLERLAALGQDSHFVLPPSLTEVRSDAVASPPLEMKAVPFGPTSAHLDARTSMRSMSPLTLHSRASDLNVFVNHHQLVGERDRPAAGSDPAASAQLYEAFGTGLDVSTIAV